MLSPGGALADDRQKQYSVLKRRLPHPNQDHHLETAECSVFRRRTKTRRIVVASMCLSILFVCRVWNYHSTIYSRAVWLLFATVTIGSATAADGAREEPHGVALHPKNIVEQIWHKFQQVTSKMETSSHQHRRKQKSLFGRNDLPLSSVDVKNLKQMQDMVLSSSQQDWIQSLFHQQNRQQATNTAPTQHEKQPQVKSIAVSSRKRRRLLYKNSLHQHYSKVYWKNILDADATNTTQEDVTFNETLWDLVRNVFNTYTHTLHREMNHIANQSIPDEKLDRTTSLHTALPPFPKSSVSSNRQLIRNMFQHGYDSYMYHAFPAGEIHPISCQPGTFDLVRIPALTVFDSLDTLLVLGNVTEFARAVERIRNLHLSSTKKSIFAIDQNVSVFETNIRVLGGLISAHQLALAYQLDTPTGDNTKSRSRPESKFILRLDIFDAAGDVRWGPLEHHMDPVVRWWQYQQDDDDDELSVCAAVDAASFIGVSSDAGYFSSVAPCDSSLLSLQDCSIAVSGFTWQSNVCCKQVNKTATSAAIPSNDYWTYDGFLLDLALDIGKRLLPAFSTITGIPYGTVNLLYGVPLGETTVASLAGGGTLTLEFELLSRLTGDARFGKAARLASRALFRHRSQLNLFGKHIDINTGTWVETLSGIGSNSDSFLEYLAKHYMLFPEDDDFWIMFKTAYGGVFNESRLGEWYADVDLNAGVSSGNGRRVFESLAAFYPGLQALLGEITPAARSLNSFFIVREILGFLPERFNYGIWNLDHGQDGAAIHPLRPELLESCYFLHRATKGLHAGISHSNVDQSSGWEWAADFALHKLESATRSRCGYAGLRELKPHTTGTVDGTSNGIKYMNEMPSFFLSETLKYLFLTFDDDNVLHHDDNHQWIFTTEAHPVHYVPQKHAVHPSSERRDLTFDIASLKTILQHRLRPFRKFEPSNRSKFDDTFFRGKWTKVVDNRSYRDDIQGIVLQGSVSILNRNFSPIDNGFSTSNSVLPFIPSGPFLVDTFGESHRKRNVAHLSFGNWGSGVKLHRECTNVYSSDLLWMQALNGGAADYSDSYVSSGYDSFIEDPHFFTMFGAADALGALGVGIYVGEKDLKSFQCPISQSSLGEVVPETVDEVVTVDDSPVKIVSEIGNFEVSTFPNGAGFHVRHLENDEFVTANFFMDENLDIGQIAIVHTELCTDQWMTMPKTTSESDEVEEPFMQIAREKRRQTSIVDFNGHSFTCKVQVFRRRDVPEGEEIGRDEVALTIPCSPAMFGPTHISFLKEQKKIEVEALLLGPRENNLWGCIIPPSSSQDSNTEVFIPVDTEVLNGTNGEQCESNAIHIVHRGECTFFEKAVNMNNMWNIDGLIVINSSEEMFMMSAAEEENYGVDPSDIPLSVLISQLDGAKMLESLSNSTAVDCEVPSSIFARIAIEQQFMNLEQERVENGKGSIDWPIVQGNSNVLHVLAEFGWGIHALIKREVQHQTCEISILKHSFDKGT